MAPRAGAVPLEEALAKKGGLTLQQLATYDDLITDALVDRVSISNPLVPVWLTDSLSAKRSTTGPQ